MSYLLFVVAGLFLCNCIPHLAAGLRGEPFPTPFAKPPGRGNSPPVVNVLWGALNLFAGVALLRRGMGLSIGPELLAAAAAFLLAGLFLARHFGRVRGA